nr:MAG TPA: hypothetical protein [Caudoviricetes sp.]
MLRKRRNSDTNILRKTLPFQDERFQHWWRNQRSADDFRQRLPRKRRKRRLARMARKLLK